MERKEASAADITFEWQVFQTARGVMVLDGWGTLLGTFSSIAAAVIGMLAVEAGPPPCQASHNDNRAA